MDERSNHSFPRAALWGAAGLMALSIVLAGVGRLGGFGKAESPQVAPAVSAELRFEDQADGSVAVYDAPSGTTVAVLDPGTNGFIRGVLRGFARERRQWEIGPQPPLRLTRWENGSLSLEDPQTGRRIELEAFGQTNFAAFARLLGEGERAVLITVRLEDGRRAIEVPCTIDLENTLDSLHAYVDLEGVEVGPGDEVLIIDAPTEIPPYGQRIVCERRAALVRATALGRLRTYLTSRLELPELYEVGFQSWRCP